METQQLTLASIEQVDNGLPAKLFQSCLKSAVLDCIDRPADKKAREVYLKVLLTPKIDQQGSFDGCNVEFVSACKVPPQRTNAYAMDGRRGGQLAFVAANTTDEEQDDS